MKNNNSDYTPANYKFLKIQKLGKSNIRNTDSAFYNDRDLRTNPYYKKIIFLK